MSENDALQQKIKSLSERVDQLTSLKFNQANQREQLDEVLPSDLKLGHVKGLNYRDREVQIRMGKKVAGLPMASLHVVPKINDVCIVQIEGGNISVPWYWKKLLSRQICG